MIVFAVLTDGRDDLLDRTLDSADEMLGHADLISQRVMWDDTGDPSHQAALALAYPEFDVVGNGRRNGFGGAMREMWAHVRARSAEPFVFWLEDDFIFLRPVDLGEMADVLAYHPHLAQMALRRQAWNDTEKAAGGLIEASPEDFDEKWSAMGARWLEHRKWFTTNPSMFRRQLLDVDWPDGDRSEGRFTHHLLDHGFAGVLPEKVRFGYWGRRQSGVWVQHEGNVRAGVGY